MAEIIVRPVCCGSAGSSAFDVTVSDADGKADFSVEVSAADLDRLADGKMAAADLVRRSFEFLLERESKRAILRRFNLRDISRYFPEYDSEMAKLWSSK